MNRNIGLWQFCGYAAVTLFGTLLHFLYDWTDSTIAALFSGVNESTWEHMKLLFFPMVLFAIVQAFFLGKDYENFWCIKMKGVLLGIGLIPVIFYTLRGVFGTTPDWVNIAIFFVAAAVAFVWETRRLRRGSMPCRWGRWAGWILGGMAVLFWVFTFVPPEIPLFLDPTDGTYGIFG